MNVSEIRDAISNEIVARKCYIVDVTVSKDNDVEVTIESEEGTVDLEDCVAISRHFESKFDREKEDYSLTVTSAGLDQPFKVIGQYRKFEGQEVEVVMKQGGKIKGILGGITEEGFEITTSKMVKKEGAKKKVQEDTVTPYTYEQIKSCKPVIKFK